MLQQAKKVLKIHILTELAFVGFGQGLPPPGPLQDNMINEILTYALNVHSKQ